MWEPRRSACRWLRLASASTPLLPAHPTAVAMLDSSHGRAAHTNSLSGGLPCELGRMTALTYVYEPQRPTGIISTSQPCARSARPRIPSYCCSAA